MSIDITALNIFKTESHLSHMAWAYFKVCILHICSRARVITTRKWWCLCCSQNPFSSNCGVLEFKATLECLVFLKLKSYVRKSIWQLLLLLLLSRFSRVRLCATPYTAAQQAPPSLGFSRQEHWSGLPFPPPMHESEKWKGSRSVVSDSSRPHGLQPTRLLRPWDFPGKSTGVGCHCLLRYNNYDVDYQSPMWPFVLVHSAITNDHRLSTLNKNTYVSWFPRLKVWDQGTSMVGFLMKAFFLVFRLLSSHYPCIVKREKGERVW